MQSEVGLDGVALVGDAGRLAMRRFCPLLLVATLVVQCVSSVGAAQFSVLVSSRGPVARPPSPVAWSRALHTPDWQELSAAEADARRGAAWALGRRGSPGRATGLILRALVRERSPEVRAELLTSLARRAQPEAVAGLSRALASRRDSESEMAALGLAAVGTPEAIDALMEGLANPQVATHAALGLRRLRAAAIDPLLGALERGEGAAVDPLTSLAERGLRVSDVHGALSTAARASAPRLRLAGLRGLARVAVTADQPRLLEALEDDSPEAVGAALRGLARVADASAWGPLMRALDGAGDDDRLPILRAMWRSDRRRAEALLLSLDAGRDAEARAQAATVALEHPSPGLLPIYRRLVEAGGDAGAAALSVLAELPGGVGVGILLEQPGAEASVELALRLRRGSSEGSAAIEHRLRASPAALPLLALAGLDPGERLQAALRAEQPTARVSAAQIAAWTGDARWRPDLRAALAAERTPEVAGALAQALTALGGVASPVELERWLDRPESAPEVMVLAARATGARFDLTFRRRLRQWLRADEPRVRAAAARALALVGDSRAVPALVSALDDPREEVRLSVVSALAELGAQGSTPGLRAAARVERADAVVERLVALLAGAPRGYDPPGERVLRVSFRGAGATTSSHWVVDVVLADGRWLRVGAVFERIVVVPGLAPGVADVRPLLSFRAP